jgi:hypothetical protein
LRRSISFCDARETNASVVSRAFRVGDMGDLVYGWPRSPPGGGARLGWTHPCHGEGPESAP